MDRESRVVVNTLLSFVARAARAGTTILLVPYLLAKLGESRYGIIGLVNSILGLAVLIELGLRPAASREFSRFVYSGELRRSNELASTTLVASLLLGAALLAGLTLLADPLLSAVRVPVELMREGRGALLLAAGSVVLSLVTTPYSSALIARLRYDIQHFATVLEASSRLILLLLAFSLWTPRLELWGACILASSAFAFLLQRSQAHRRCPSLELSSRLASRRGVRDLATSGSYTSVAQLAEWLTNQSGPLILGFFLSTVAVAHYHPAQIIGLTLLTLSSGFLLQLHPILTEAWIHGRTEGIRRTLIRSTRYSLLLTGGAAVAVAVLAPQITQLWLGEGFEDTTRTLQVWCAAALLHSATGGAFPLFIAAGRYRFIARAAAALATLNVAVAVLLVGSLGFGPVGIALGVLVGQAVRTAVWLIFATRLAGLAWRDYLRRSLLGPSLSLCGLALSAAVLQQLNLPGTGATLAVAAAGSSAIYAALAWRVGLRPDDRVRAREQLSRGLDLLRHLRSGS
ncbi:MAG: lipopolysaccharide biosynthesis protein [Myxococcota bacterium]